jgi:predicted metal-binding protein
MYQDVEYWIKLKVDLFVAIRLKYWSCLTSVRCLNSINYKKRQQNCTRIQSNIITFYNWNCLGFYVEDTICEMEQDSNLKFNACKLLKKRNKGQNKYNLVNHKKNKSKKGSIKIIFLCLHSACIFYNMWFY